MKVKTLLKRNQGRLRKTVAYSGMLLGAVVMAVPFLWMVLTSFKTFPETLKYPITWLPAKVQFENFAVVINRFSFGRYTLNTIFVTAVLTLGQLAICSLAAYAFSRLSFPGKGFLFFLILSILMVPEQMTLIPRFLIVQQLGWLNTFKGIIIPSLPSAYGTFFLVQFMKTLPREIEESGKIDGCSIFRLFWSITLPMCKNGIIALGIIVVLWAWNSLLWPLIVANSDKVSVLAIGLATLNAMPGYTSRYNVLMAGAVLVTIPMLAVFIAGQKKLISGIAISGMKA